MKPVRTLFCDDCIETARAEKPLPVCNARQPQPPAPHSPVGYHCSRPRGHAGPHVACYDEAHQLARW
jgi:hypothetical protein